MSKPAKPPPWEPDSSELTALESCVDLAYRADLSHRDGEAAWSELQALQAVAEAAESLVAQNYRGPEDNDALSAALKEWRAICPK